MEKQTSIAEKQYKRLEKVYELDKNKYEKIKKEKPAAKIYHRSNLVDGSKYSFYEYHNVKFNSLSLATKYPSLPTFYNDLNKFNSLQPQKECEK